jgi:hypothetical protein
MKSDTKEKTHTTEKEYSPEKLISEMAAKAMMNYEQAVRMGLKLQEEAAQFFTSVAGPAVSMQDCQKRIANLTAMASNAIPEAQKGMEEVLALAEKNSQQSLELMKKAAEAAQTPVIAESQAKWMDVWSESLAAARSNAETLTRIGSKAIDSWIDYVRKNTEVTELRVPKAA